MRNSSNTELRDHFLNRARICAIFHRELEAFDSGECQIKTIRRFVDKEERTQIIAASQGGKRAWRETSPSSGLGSRRSPGRRQPLGRKTEMREGTEHEKGFWVVRLGANQRCQVQPHPIHRGRAEHSTWLRCVDSKRDVEDGEGVVEGAGYTLERGHQARQRCRRSGREAGFCIIPKDTAGFRPMALAHLRSFVL